MRNRTVVVTGATSGIGKAFAEEYARRSYSRVITGRRKEKLEETAEEIRRQHGVSVEVVLAELSMREGIQAVLNRIKGREVEVLVNNAGFGVSGLYQETDLGALEQLALVNVLAPMDLIHAILPGMVERRSGTIINVSSDGVYLIMPKNAVYVASKAFLKALTEGLHMDLAETGVRVMALCPGLTHTDFHERIGMPKTRQTDRGPVHWMSPEDVVREALSDLEKGRVVSIPGAYTRWLTRILGLLPRRSY